MQQKHLSYILSTIFHTLEKLEKSIIETNVQTFVSEH